MRKLTLLIISLFVTLGTMAQINVNTSAYTVKSVNRGFLYYDANNEGYVTSSSHTNITDATPTGATNEQFAFLPANNTAAEQYYMYSIGAEKFVTYTGTNGVKLELTDEPVCTWTLVKDGSYYGIKVPNTTNTYINITNWEAHLGCKVIGTGLDNGNRMTLTEVGTVDLTAAKSKILLSTANETGAVYTIEGGSLNQHRGFLAAGEGYNDYPVLSDIAWSDYSGNSTPAIDNGKNWYVYRKAENEWYIYNVALEKFLAAEDGNINFSPFPYSWIIAENTRGEVNYLVIKDASEGVSFACGTRPRNVKYNYEAHDGGSMHIFTPAQGVFSAQIAANVKAKLNMPAPGSYIRIKSAATNAYLSSVNHATKTTRAAYVADADVTTIFKFDGTSLYSYASRQYLVNNSNFLGYGSTESGATIEFQAANVSLNLENAYSIKLFGANRWLYAHADNYTDAGDGNNAKNYSFYLEEVTELPITLEPGYYTIACGEKYVSDDKKSAGETERVLTTGEVTSKNIFYYDGQALIGYASGCGFEYACCNTGNKGALNFFTFYRSTTSESEGYLIKSSQGNSEVGSAEGWGEGYWKANEGNYLERVDKENASLWTLTPVTMAAQIGEQVYYTLEDAKAAALATTDAVEIVLLAETDATIVFPANVTINKNGFTAEKLAVAVAKIGDTLYASIEAALEEAQAGETITLVADVTCTEKPVFTKGGVVNVNINGHVFESNERPRVRCVASADGTVASNNIKFVSGFGSEVYNDDNAKFRVYPNLNDAIEYGIELGRAVRIYPYENVVQNADVVLPTAQGTASTICPDRGYDITWDLNGYTVLQESPTGNPLEASVNGKFTLDDTSEAKTGKWIAGACGVTDTSNETWYGGGGPAFYVLGDGELILKGGRVSIARNASENSEGEPVVNEGGLIRLDSGSLTVDGATLQCDDTYGVMAWSGNVVVNSGKFVMGENGAYSVFASSYYADASVEVNTAIDGYLLISSTAKATVNVPGVKYVANGTDYVAPAVGEGLVAQGGVVGYPVAKIGETGYLTLEAAVAAAEGQTITLVADVELTETLVIAAGKTITLNLNGKTVDVAWEDEEDGRHIYALTNNGTLTVTGDGTINTRGIYNYGDMTLTSGTINAIDGNGGYGVCNYDGATFIMNGGTIATTLEDDNEVDEGGFDATPVYVEEGATFTMNGGVINNICDFTVAINNYGTTIINDGEATTVHTTLANHGTMTINGGEFTCDGIEGITAHALWADAGETTINGGTFNGKDNFNGFNVDASKDAVVNITGGTFLAVHSGSLYGEGTITVSGGTFFDAVPADRCADGFVPKANGDGTYGVVADPNYIAEFIIDDAARVDYDNDTDKTVGTLTYKRTLAEGAWNPLYLPFQVDVAQLADNYDIAYYNQMLSSDSNKDGAFDSYIMEVAYITSGTLRANYPYFIRPKTSDDCYLEYVANDVTLYAAIEKVIETFSVANTFRLHGTHKTVSAADLAGCYTIKASGWVQTTIDLRPHRLYLEILENNNSPFVPAAAKSIRIVVRGEDDEDGTTGIDGIYGDENGETVIFDLYGRRVLEPEKGNIYIINGKKVLVK